MSQERRWTSFRGPRRLAAVVLLALLLACGAAVSLAYMLAVGIVTEDSPAPACVEYFGFPPLTGGCFGRTAILDLSVEPEIGCLSIAVNNCNGGVLEVRNSCTETLLLGSVGVEPSGYVTLDVTQNEKGEHEPLEVYTNFTSYIPEADEWIELIGALGSREVKVTFTKTRPLCD